MEIDFKQLDDDQLVKQSNFKAKKELLQKDYKSTIEYRKSKTKNEIKGLGKSILVRQLRLSKLEDDELELLKKDKIEFKKNIVKYKNDIVENKRKYKHDIHTEKENAKLANEEINNRQILVDTYGSPHKLLELEKSDPQEIKRIIVTYNKAISKEKSRLQKSAKANVDNFIPEEVEFTSQWKNYLTQLIFKQSISKFTYDFLKGHENRAHAISLKVKQARVEVLELQNSIDELINVVTERSDELKRLKNKVESFTSTDAQEIKQRIASINEQKKQKLTEIMNQKKSGLLTKKSFKENKTKINKETQNLISLEKLHNPSFAHTKAKEYYAIKVNSVIKKNVTILNSSITNIKMSVPIVVSQEKKYLLTLLALFIPGLPQMMLGQVKKGLILAAILIPLLVISWLVALGVLGYQGEGMLGITLGAPTLNANLTASYLVEGVIGLIFFVVILAVMFGSAFHTWRQTKVESLGARVYDWNKTRNYLKQAGMPYTLGLPAILLTVFIVAVPIIASLLILFTNYDARSKFGLAEVPLEYNVDYLDELFSGTYSETFGQVMGWTITWTFGATFIVVFLGVATALMVNHKKVRAKGFWRLIYLLPWAIPGFITILFFNIANSPGGELDNLFVDWFGFDPGALKNDTQLTRIWLVFMQGWLGHSYIFLLITSGLQSIPKDLYEAAKIDGASSFRQLMKITTPIVLYQVAPLMVGQFAFNFGNFTAIYLYNGGGPRPAGQVLSLGLGQTDILATVSFKLIQGVNSKEALASAFTFFGSLIVIVPTAIGLFRTRVFRKGKL